MQYYSLLKNDIPFEIIYAGPKKPDFVIPAGNIGYIHTDSPPVVCCHKAIEQSRGEYILHAVDDDIYPEHALDKLYEQAKDKSGLYINFPSCQFRTLNKKDGSFRSMFVCDDAHLVWMGPRYLPHNKEFAPYLPPQGFMTKKLTYYEMGGFDSRLAYRNFCWDFVFRGYAAGATIEPCKEVIVEELRFGRKHKGTILTIDLEEEILFFSLWCKDDDKPERYTPHNIDIKTQEGLEYWRDARCIQGKLTVLPERSDKVIPVGA